MSDHSSIEWTDATWNPVRGCSRVSRGCGAADGGGCYAERMAGRFCGPGMPYEGLVRIGKNGPRWTGKVRMADNRILLAPLKWRTKRRVFVNSMSDLFHEKLRDEQIDRVFAVMLISALHESRGGHTYQILTKRPERQRDYLLAAPSRVDQIATAAGRLMDDADGWHDSVHAHISKHGLVHPTIWLGTSVEDQATAEERLPALEATPASIRFVSAEPLLGPLGIARHLMRGGERRIHWLIAGSESGPRSRPMDEAWVRSLRDQCTSADVAFFYKQKLIGRRKVGTPTLDGRKWVQFPRTAALTATAPTAPTAR